MDGDMNVLIGRGMNLTLELIYSLLDRPIFSVYIEEEEESVDIPGKEFLLDDVYMSCYDTVYRKLKLMFENLAEQGEFDAVALQEIMDEKNFRELCDGAKAVSQIHNMAREGSYLINHCLHVGDSGWLDGQMAESVDTRPV